MSGEALNYNTGNIKAVKTQVEESIIAIEDAYKKLQAVADSTGMGGDQGAKLKNILADTSNNITELKKKVESMDAGVEVKEKEDSVAQRQADDVWHMAR